MKCVCISVCISACYTELAHAVHSLSSHPGRKGVSMHLRLSCSSLSAQTTGHLHRVAFTPDRTCCLLWNPILLSAFSSTKFLHCWDDQARACACAPECSVKARLIARAPVNGLVVFFSPVFFSLFIFIHNGFIAVFFCTLCAIR